MVNKNAEALSKLMSRWENDTDFRHELRLDPAKALERFCNTEHLEIDATTKADIIAQVNKKTDQQLENLMSKRCG